MKRITEVFLRRSLITEVAVLSKRVGQPSNLVDSLGTSHQRDRISLWLSGSFLLHISSLAVLDQSRRVRHYHCFCSDP